MLINTGNISRKVLSKVLRSFDKNFERLHLFKIISYVFILDTTFSEENNKGIMLISEDENVFNKSNMYEYYYNKSLIPLIKGLFESNYSNE